MHGLGNHHPVDGANVPSLLSNPYLGYSPAAHPLHRYIGAFVFRDGNPYHDKGSSANGIGSPHTPAGSVWPIA